MMRRFMIARTHKGMVCHNCARRSGQPLRCISSPSSAEPNKPVRRSRERNGHRGSEEWSRVESEVVELVVTDAESVPLCLCFECNFFGREDDVVDEECLRMRTFAEGLVGLEGMVKHLYNESMDKIIYRMRRTVWIWII
jgi:hypothetical protein